MSGQPGAAGGAGSAIAPPASPEGSCWNKKNAKIIIKVVTVLCVLAAGLFSCYQMMYYGGEGGPRWHLIYFYTTLLSIMIISSEFNLMRHRSFRNFTGFLTNNTGRGVVLIFLGGTMLLNKTFGLIVGICLFVAGAMNLFSWCFFVDMNSEQDKYLQEQIAAQQVAAKESEARQRI